MQARSVLQSDGTARVYRNDAERRGRNWTYARNSKTFVETNLRSNYLIMIFILNFQLTVRLTHTTIEEASSSTHSYCSRQRSGCSSWAFYNGRGGYFFNFECTGCVCSFLFFLIEWPSDLTSENKNKKKNQPTTSPPSQPLCKCVNRASHPPFSFLPVCSFSSLFFFHLHLPYLFWLIQTCCIRTSLAQRAQSSVVVPTSNALRSQPGFEHSTESACVLHFNLNMPKSIKYQVIPHQNTRVSIITLSIWLRWRSV